MSSPATGKIYTTGSDYKLKRKIKFTPVREMRILIWICFLTKNVDLNHIIITLLKLPS
jgi:hypothetical protein